jgi:hypothetical protein
MFSFFSKKASRQSSNFGEQDEVCRLTPDAPPHVQALHLILEQSMADRATEVLMQYDRFRNEFAVYFKLNDAYEQILLPPATLFHPMQTMLASAAHLSLPEDEGQFVFPRASGGNMRWSIAIEDQGATMAMSMLGYV